MKNKLLSIIVPVYNAEKTIEKLVLTLEKQEFKDYELLLINDGSTDNTRLILEKLERNYENIIVINKINAGVGEARNTGLNEATSKYVTFIDNDDYHSVNFFEIIVPILEESNFELLCYGFNTFDSKGKISSRIKEFREKKIILGINDGLKFYLNGDFSNKLDNVNWNKIYVNEIIKKNSIRFPKNRGAMEDLLFNIEYFCNISEIDLINNKLYNYRLDFNPISNKKYYPDGNIYIKRSYELLLEKCNKFNFGGYERYLSLFFLRRIPAVIRNQSNNPNINDGIKNMKDFFNDSEINYILKKAQIRDFDYKLFICYIIYKFHLSRLLFYFLRIIKRKLN